MSVFRSRGFDSIISKGTVLRGSLQLLSDTTLVLDGLGLLSTVTETVAEKSKGKTTLVVNGELSSEAVIDTPLIICVSNVTITGTVTCDVIRVEGTLAVKSGAKLNANKILYRELVIETGAVVLGKMCHLDYVSEGEQT